MINRLQQKFSPSIRQISFQQADTQTFSQWPYLHMTILKQKENWFQFSRFICKPFWISDLLTNIPWWRTAQSFVRSSENLPCSNYIKSSSRMVQTGYYLICEIQDLCNLRNFDLWSRETKRDVDFLRDRFLRECSLDNHNHNHHHVMSA